MWLAGLGAKKTRQEVGGALDETASTSSSKASVADTPRPRCDSRHTTATQPALIRPALAVPPLRQRRTVEVASPYPHRL